MSSSTASTSFSKATPAQQNKPYTKIFWPIRCIDQKSGYLIGLNTRSFVVCVVDIVTDVPLKELEIILNKMSFDRRMLNCPLGYSPKILGEWIGKDKTVIPSPPNNLHELDIWISMERTESGDPYLRKIYCNEYKIQTSSQIVLYDDTPPYYYTSIPIKFESMLSLVSKTTNNNQSNKLLKSNNSVFSPSSSSTAPSSPTSKKHQIGSELESTFKQINCSHDIKTILHEAIQKHFQYKQRIEQQKKKEEQQKQKLDQKNDSQSDTDSENQSFFSKTLFTLRFRKNSRKQQDNTQSLIQQSSKPNDSNNSNSTNNSNGDNKKSIKDILLSPLYFFIWFVQVFSRLIEKILYIPAPLYKGGRLKDMTTLGTHLDNRIFQVKQLSKQWNHLKKKTYWINNNDDRSSYIEFHNSAWLIFNDILLGIAAGLLLNFFSDRVLFLIGKLNFFLNNDLLKSLILWLMGWPGGFKLNENLDKFFGRLVLYYIDKWNLITAAISPHGQLFLQIICLSGIMGLSFLISVVIDLFYIFTLHISVFYSVSARFYLLQLLLLNSLWNLFRGVKFNPLRKRIDHCDFDVYQLLLGTLLFTLIFFLFPTTAIYYLFFAVFKAGVSIVKGIFALLLHFLNTFPLFNLLIFSIDKRYLPGGVIFEYKKKDMDNFKNNPNIIVDSIDQQQQQDKDKQQQQQQVDQQLNNDGSGSLINSPSTTNTNNSSSTSISSPVIIQHSRNLSGTLIGSTGGGVVSNSTNISTLGSYHKRNLSQSSTSPITRISAQLSLEITYFTIKIKPTNLSTFFLPTIHLIQNTIKTYHPSKLSKCFFMGKPLNKIS
ncbi:hypothetical protein DICPUDRAFT_152826 [Dictyostelium purpureum]|uniref:Uncharacterized protein n=1 Tax=Dictyostelium purpureum TaxID=5786 RepID=F0ZMD2_DICPU|nr:uncharacterized protein DICPUDRAFT_152826 [Dictyostelium purpureum]EGC34896.1 hypothetical protein DICPUDRAFT_152826 [Dictyostelium purpureum]|eukprot:XP_003288588.1 hypothetical protein DICPUDRAFT_152826 [Dictyostelium purpureum]